MRELDEMMRSPAETRAGSHRVFPASHHADEINPRLQTPCENALSSLASNGRRPARFCGQCGKPLSRATVPLDSRPREVCNACGTVHYENPRILVACVAEFESQLVLCQRAMAPAKGLWFLPSGFMELDEALEVAAVRELHEETGLLIRSSELALYSVLSIPRLNEVYAIFRVTLAATPSLSPGVESSDVRLFRARSCPNTLAFPQFFRGFLSRYFNDAAVGRFPVRSQIIDSEH